MGSRRTVTGATTVLIGTSISLVGIAWDVQWHIEVGPDTFFTLPHLLLYSGSAIAGIASLVMVLMATAEQRAGGTLDPADGGVPVRVFGGRFHAPLGYLVSGVGAACFLLYGLIDLWWHTVYGFDAVLNSPPHVALFTAISVTMVGSVIVYASARQQRWGRIGLMISVPILMTFFPITANAFQGLPLPFDPIVMGTVLFVVLLLVLVVGVVRQPGTALATAAVLGVIQAVLWVFSPWAAQMYASMVGLPMRDGLRSMAPLIPAGIPMTALLAAAIIEVILLQGRTHGWSARTTPPIAGAVAGLVIAFTFQMQRFLLGYGGLPTTGIVISTAVAGALFGLLAGWLGWRFAIMLRSGTREAVPA